MKKSLSVLSLIVLICVSVKISYSQTLLVAYERHNVNVDHPAISNTINYDLILTPTKSLCITASQNLKHNLETKDGGTKGDFNVKKISDDYYILQGKNKTLYYKDYLKDSLIYHATIFTRKFEVGEELLNRYQWEITTKDTTFLGYTCRIATCEFRGQKWTAIFTDSFGLNGGPWKFDGLPGVILQIYNHDKTYHFSATKVELQKETQILNNPFEKNHILSWNEFTDLYKKRAVAQVKSINAKNEEGDRSSASIKLNNPIEDLGFEKISSK